MRRVAFPLPACRSRMLRAAGAGIEKNWVALVQDLLLVGRRDVHRLATCDVLVPERKVPRPWIEWGQIGGWPVPAGPISAVAGQVAVRVASDVVCRVGGRDRWVGWRHRVVQSGGVSRGPGRLRGRLGAARKGGNPRGGTSDAAGHGSDVVEVIALVVGEALGIGRDEPCDVVAE